MMPSEKVELEFRCTRSKGCHSKRCISHGVVCGALEAVAT